MESNESSGDSFAPHLEMTTHSQPAVRRPKLPGTVESFVNETLSRGLADRALAVLEAQGARYRDAFMRILQRDVRSKKAATAMAAALEELGERARIVQVIGKSPNGRHIAACQFVPVVGDPIANRARFVTFELCTYQISSRGYRLGPDWGNVLIASEHAVERLFLRLNTLDLGEVFTELHDAMLLARPITVVGLTLGIRQVALPTTSGAFLCELRADRNTLVAKTWLGSENLGSRWSPIVAGVRNAISAAGGEAALASVIALGIEAALTDEVHVVFDNLSDALSKFRWLEEPYIPRPDPVGDVWKGARNAATTAPGIA